MTTQQTNANNREPWLSIILSTFFPGIGQIYAGRDVRGFIFICISLSFIGVGSWLFLSPTQNIWVASQFLVGYLVFSIFNLFDAYYCTRKSNDIEFEIARKNEKDPWLAVFLNRVIPGLGHAYQGKWISAILFFVFIVGARIVANTSPFILLVAFGLAYFSLYHVYIFAPNKREQSNKYIEIICIVLFVLEVIVPLSIKTFVAEARYIPSSAMEPTLLKDDRLIIDKLSFRWHKPERGEIIVFNPPNNPVVPDASKVYIKRVIGLPSDRISIHDGKVFVNDSPLNEPYIAQPLNYTLPTQDASLCPNCFSPDDVKSGKNGLFFTVPNGQYWMMGDDRNNSLDSHAWGFLPEKNLIGRAIIRYYPFDSRAGKFIVPKY